MRPELDPKRDPKKGRQVAPKATPGCADSPNRPNPRAGVVADLSARLAELVAAGDLEGARAVSDAIARLLGSNGTASHVHDLDLERAKRGKV
jgi:hypothetical protein